MAVGVDGKLYIHHQMTDYIIVLDGIEENNITEETISSECLKSGYFPHLPRISYKPPCLEIMKPKIIVE
ncbi:MAG: hypothetical protein II956_05070 [Bacteroidales bacterium]|nr:hypothetical protein [Bacteroidales bacterium]